MAYCSCSCVKKPLRNWRRNKNAKQQNVDVSLKNDVENQRILKAPTKVFILVFHFTPQPHTPLVPNYFLFSLHPFLYLSITKKKKEISIPPHYLCILFIKKNCFIYNEKQSSIFITKYLFYFLLRENINFTNL